MKVLRDINGNMTSHPQLVNGAEFILREPDHVPAIFGRGSDVLWAEGEPLLLVGPQGVGKTTLLQQAALRRASVLDGDLLGFPVKADPDELTLYLALDRPQQIARSFKRMVADEQRLGQLVVWKGPLPFNLVETLEKLVLFVQDIGEMYSTPVRTVCADSLKDMASPLSSDEVGAALNRAIGGVIARDIELAACHHQRKATAENKKPTSLSDVYGSTWITAGAGSVILLWGEPGDPVVELTHLKQPAEEVGPLELVHDHEHGVTMRRDRPDAWTVLQAATAAGVSTTDAAQAIYGVKPSKAQIEKARRRFERFVSDGHAVKIEPSQQNNPTLYRPIVTNAAWCRVDPSHGPCTQAPRISTNGSSKRHAPSTPGENPTVTAPTPLKGGERDGSVELETVQAQDKEEWAQLEAQLAAG